MIYEYECPKCGHVTERYTTKYYTTTTCEKCKARAKKIISGNQMFRKEKLWREPPKHAHQL